VSQRQTGRESRLDFSYVNFYTVWLIYLGTISELLYGELARSILVRLCNNFPAEANIEYTQHTQH
jgi:hypothetical protein